MSNPKSVGQPGKTSKPDCHEPAAKAIREVLLARLKKMCARRERALDEDDPEGVHDMRVASRRLRSAISDFEPYLRKGSIPLTRLKSIAKHLGAVRDQDVVLAALADLGEKAQPEIRKGVETIGREHRRARALALTALERAIGPASIAEFRKEFQAKVRAATDTPLNDPEREESGDVLTFGRMGVRVIADRLQQLSKAGGSIYRPLETKKLHQLRIASKKLRYAIELFAPCSGAPLAEFAEEIARFQTSLGELHDCDVWIDSLGTRLRKQRKSGANNHAPGRHREVSVWLLHYFTGERTKHYCHALARWHKWETEGFLTRLEGMMNSDFAATVVLPQKEEQSLQNTSSTKTALLKK